MAADPQRPDGWVATFFVEVVFDTNEGRTCYDHVGTVARCTCCGDWLDLSGSPSGLARHARSHEAAHTGHPVARHTATFDDAIAGGSATSVASVRSKEVTTEHTTD